ncbi:MAG TPA: alpha/beta hydrolase [Tepidisphaeraceae bacterium]
MDKALDVTPRVIEDAGFFDGPAGRLYRRIARPTNRAVARLSIVHGYGDHSGRYAHFMQWMALRGVACGAVDLRGQGAADGRRGFVRRWEDYLDDVRAFLSLPAPGETEAAPRFILGHSHGGLVVAAAGEAGLLETAGIRGVVLTSPFLQSRMELPRVKVVLGRLVGLAIPWLPVSTGLNAEWMSSDSEMVEQTRNDPLCARVATPRWYAGQLRAQQRVMENAASFRLPLLVLAAGADPIAEPAAAERFVQRVGSAEKAFRILPGLLHELLRERGREQIFQEILTWVTSR